MRRNQFVTFVQATLSTARLLCAKSRQLVLARHQDAYGCWKGKPQCLPRQRDKIEWFEKSRLLERETACQYHAPAAERCEEDHTRVIFCSFEKDLPEIHRRRENGHYREVLSERRAESSPRMHVAVIRSLALP